MILNKAELKYYLKADAIAISAGYKHPHFFSIYESDIIWKYQIVLRKTEYWYNTKKKNLFCYILAKFYQYRLFRMQVKTGISIPINVFGPGLSISHLGPIVVNGFVKVGKNCRLHPMVTIGMDGRSGAVAMIGDNVYISAGAKIIGDVKITDDVCIGAGAVVTKSISESHTTWAGVPAKKISDQGSGFPMNRRGADVAETPRGEIVRWIW